jgi:hypothetical protein
MPGFNRPAPKHVRAAGGLALLAALLTVVLSCAKKEDAAAPDPAPEPVQAAVPSVDFKTWPDNRKPDLVLFLTGQTYGYLSPCGCSRPQKGGLERRANLMDSLRAKGWEVVGLDLGDAAAQKGLSKQNLLKYQATMKSLSAMGYAAVGLGEQEFAADLYDLLTGFTLNNPNKPPFVLAGNILGVAERDAAGKVTKTFTRAEKFPGGGADARPMVEAFEVVERPGKPAVAVVGVIGPDVLAKVEAVDKQYAFVQNDAYLAAVLKEVAKHPAKPEVKVLLYAGKLDAAKKAAAAFPQFQLILCQSDDSLPPQYPTPVNDGKTLIVQVGHKGQHAGVLGVFKVAGGYEFKYTLATLGEEYVTPDEPERVKGHKVLPTLEWYAEEVKRQDLLAEARKKAVPHQAQIQFPNLNLTYVGDARCAACHAAEHAKWSETKHAHASDALLPKYSRRPENRQFDPECVVCHSTGFEYKTGFENEKRTPFLKHNGCENCHGPGSGHATNPKDPQLLAALAPWKTKPEDRLPDLEFLKKMAETKPLDRGKVQMPANQQQLVNTVSLLCIRCHDTENDPKFDFYEYFPKIHHSGLKKKD